MAAVSEPKILSINLGHLALKNFNKKDPSLSGSILWGGARVFQSEELNGVDFLVFQATRDPVFCMAIDCFKSEFKEPFALIERCYYKKKRFIMLAIAFNIQKFIYQSSSSFGLDLCPVKKEDEGGSTIACCFRPILDKGLPDQIHISNTSAGRGIKARISQIKGTLFLLKERSYNFGHFFFCQDFNEESDEIETMLLQKADFKDIGSDLNCLELRKFRVSKIYYKYVEEGGPAYRAHLQEIEKELLSKSRQDGCALL